MRELLEHPAYKLINGYNCVVLDYIIIENDIEYTGLLSHKTAAIFGMETIKNRWDQNASYLMSSNSIYKKYKRNRFPYIKKIDPSKMKGSIYSLETFFGVPSDHYYQTKPRLDSRSYSVEKHALYAYAFLEPPYPNHYLIKDWQVLNSVLFPDQNRIEIYSWNANWSDYFKDGLEWWGTYYWSIYDRALNIFTIIGGSATD